MEFEIANEGIQSAIENGATSAIQTALDGYEVKSAISTAIANEVIGGAIGEALRRAVHAINTEALTQRLAEELERNVTRSVIHLLTEGLVETVATLRGLKSYSDDDKAERSRLRAELFGSLARDQRGSDG